MPFRKIRTSVAVDLSNRFNGNREHDEFVLKAEGGELVCGWIQSLLFLG
jgi:hypothetical protein